MNLLTSRSAYCCVLATILNPNRRAKTTQHVVSRKTHFLPSDCNSAHVLVELHQLSLATQLTTKTKEEYLAIPRRLTIN